jgi:hypothetical protein
MKLLHSVLILAVSMLFTTGINADSIRCGTHIIEDADLHKIVTKEEVIKKCGKPSYTKGNSLYYKKKGKRLDFDSENRLMSMHEIEDD